MTHSFIVCKHLTNNLVTGLDMQQIYRIGSDWTQQGKLYLHQGCHVLINFLRVNETKPNCKHYVLYKYPHEQLLFFWL